MVKLILVNVLLFIGCIILFVFMAAGIGYAMGTARHDVENALAYVFVAGLHIFINFRLLKKWQPASLRARVVSTILIIAAYIIYLFIY